LGRFLPKTIKAITAPDKLNLAKSLGAEEKLGKPPRISFGGIHLKLNQPS
jgi:hypothetical protein